MSDGGAEASRRTDVLQDVLHEIETLRFRRQEEVRERPHPLLKRFTQQELTDEACPTYKNLLVGRSLRVPSRQTIIQIAEYLECGVAQRNHLLLAARYLPDSLELEGAQLAQALEQARRVMGTLPFPAMIVKHTLEVEAINEAFQCLFESPPLAAIPRTQRHILHFFFQQNLPIRERSTFNARAAELWHAGVSRSIHIFKQSNMLYQFEPWYQDLVEQLCSVADFRQYWEQASELGDQPDAPTKLLLGRHAATGELLPVRFQQIRISICSHMYPCILAFLPLDDAAQMLLASFDRAEGASVDVAARH